MPETRRQILGQLAGALVAGPLFADARPKLQPTPNEIVGPFYPITKPADTDIDLTRIVGHAARAKGQVIELTGRVVDLAGRPLGGVRIETWQANAAGRYAHASDDNPAPLDPDFQGYGLLITGADGSFRMLTIKPGAYPGGRRGMRAPHIHFDVQGRVDRVVAQMYFPGEALNETDALLRANIRPELVMSKAAGANATGIRRFEWDIILRTA